MKHEVRCIEIPCTCVTILREKVKSLEKKIEDGLSCCCSGCTKHNQNLLSETDQMEKFLKVIREWKFSWMNQTQNNKQDFENYYSRAFGIDSNMIHSLAHRLLKAL